MNTPLWTGRAHEAGIWRYRPGERHTSHTDRWSRTSILLSGGYREESRAGAIRMGVADILLKSREVIHDDVYGQDGAVLLALEFGGDDSLQHSIGAAGPNVWILRRCRMAACQLEAALEGDGATIDAVGTDLVATSEEAETRRHPLDGYCALSKSWRAQGAGVFGL